MTDKRQLKITDINEFGVLLTVIPKISLDEEAWVIKAELKLAHMELNIAMKQWEDKTIEKLKEKS